MQHCRAVLKPVGTKLPSDHYHLKESYTPATTVTVEAQLS